MTASPTAPERTHRRQRSAQRKTPGNLVAITPTGPVYRGSSVPGCAPVSS